MTSDGEGAGRPRSLAARIAAGFGLFWWDFLVGDTPELFVGSVAAVGLAALVCLDPSLRDIAALSLPLLVAAVLGLSVWKVGRKGLS